MHYPQLDANTILFNYREIRVMASLTPSALRVAEKYFLEWEGAGTSGRSTHSGIPFTIYMQPHLLLLVLFVRSLRAFSSLFTTESLQSSPPEIPRPLSGTLYPFLKESFTFEQMFVTSMLVWCLITAVAVRTKGHGALISIYYIIFYLRRFKVMACYFHLETLFN